MHVSVPVTPLYTRYCTIWGPTYTHFSPASLHLYASTHEVPCAQMETNQFALTSRQNKQGVNQVDLQYFNSRESQKINRDLLFNQNVYVTHLNRRQKWKQSTMKQMILSCLSWISSLLFRSHWAIQGIVIQLNILYKWRWTYTRNIRLSLKVQPKVVWPWHTLSAFKIWQLFNCSHCI